MTSTSINKIVRSNFNLKPWILSKKTNEIVNTCIQKIYKEIPNNYKNDLLHTKIAEVKPEHRGPIRSLKVQEHIQSPTISASRTKSRVSNMSGHRLLSAVMNNSKKNSLTAGKKLLKSPNYKIYGSRRFGSSASSSNASIFRRYDERRRNRQTAHLNQLLRTFATNGSKNNFGLSTAMAKYIVPARNQHMESTLSSVPRAIELSSAIQRDLMLIDNAVKDRIALGGNRMPKAPIDMKTVGSLDGWNHPPPPDLFLTRLSERGMANSELHEQHRRLKTVSRTKHTDIKTLLMPISSTGSRKSRPLSDHSTATKESMKRSSHTSTRAPTARRVTQHKSIPETPTAATHAPVEAAATRPSISMTIKKGSTSNSTNNNSNSNDNKNVIIKSTRNDAPVKVSATASVAGTAALAPSRFNRTMYSTRRF